MSISYRYSPFHDRWILMTDLELRMKDLYDKLLTTNNSKDPLVIAEFSDIIKLLLEQED